MSKLAADTAMVLAAGLGKRMRPLTATRPKPLVRVGARRCSIMLWTRWPPRAWRGR